ncbi:(2Fe-2S)-binding protein [Streptomyces sp. OF3]|uniref:(2Fe-2S)-binding protein n=1 Tax=Streptomyces alkaliterrae TaxID=2213162 RepID=A0A7W3WQ70_9ACTN|nr:(2Fe-2S)-binding protein [Streptomyces alkaliterrae]
MSSDQQQPGQPAPTAPPTGGWGGAYDAEATAFIQLPGPGAAPPYPGDGRDADYSPLAAPGTGPGWEPPVIPPMTPAASTDPAATGQWTMPFAPEPAHGADAALSQGLPGAPDLSGVPDASGQGAAAALAGAHEARRTPERHLAAAGGETPSGEPSSHEPPSHGPLYPAHAHDSAGHELFAAGGPGGDDRRQPAEHGDPPPGAAAPASTSEESPSAADDAEAAGDGDTSDDAEPPADEHPLVSYVLHVNGADKPVTDAWIGESLLYVLRERLGLAGAKDGCSQGECGACSVQVDGRLVASCLVPAATAARSDIRTVEGLAHDDGPCDVQHALADRAGAQCGFCLPGMAMTVHDLLAGNHAPTDLEIRKALCGNLCRCSGYRGIVEAVRDVVATRAAEAERAAAEQSAEQQVEAHGPHDGDHSGHFDAAGHPDPAAPPRVPEQGPAPHPPYGPGEAQ